MWIWEQTQSYLDNFWKIQLNVRFILKFPSMPFSIKELKSITKGLLIIVHW